MKREIIEGILFGLTIIIIFAAGIAYQIAWL
jgi:hypothetical protein